MAEKTIGTQSLGEGFLVGAWRVEPALNRLSKGDREIRLEPKVMQVLVCLAERPEKTVTKEQFMETVWNETVVTDDVLARCISELRKALGDDARDPEYIETIRKAGYRLIAPVSQVRAGPRPPQVEPRVESRVESRLETMPVPVASAPQVPEGAASADPASRWKKATERAARWASTLRRRRSFWIGVVAAGLLVAALLGGRRWLAAEDAPGPPEIVPLTSFPGEEFDAALSPDGQRVAFAWDGGGENVDIYVKQTRGETPLRITERAAEEHSPTWSPDGEQLAFVRMEEGKARVVIVPALGGSEREVARFESEIQGLAWSPKGKELAVAAQSVPYEAFSIFLLSLETLEKRRLTFPPGYQYGDTHPAFSPDGQKVAFARGIAEGVEDIYTMDLEDDTPRRLSHDGTDVTGLDWAADGRSIILASNRDGPYRLWRLPASGGTPEWVAASGEDMHQPSIARQGDRIAVTQRSFDTNIWELRSVSGYGPLTARRQIASTQWDSSPDVSSDGERVAFASKRSGHFEIWTSRRDGSDPVQLTSFEGPFTTTPRWSPGGQRIAFVSRKDEQADIFVISAAGGKPRRLTMASTDEVAPSWSRDGRWIYFSSNHGGHWQVWKVASDGGTPEQVTIDGGFAAFESPDSQWLYYVKRDTPGIWRRPLLGGKETRVAEGLAPYDWGNWAITERGLYFVRRDADGPVLIYHNVQSGRSTRLALLGELPRRPALAVGSEGRWFLYARVDRSESDVLLVKNVLQGS